MPPSTSDSADPFGTAALRATVLATWRDSPTRFREDANSEEDLVLGGYRDRLLVELLQNAADAAARSGEPGRVRVRLDGEVLTVANTGLPLSVAGVQALASLRASAKRDQATAGRFGVGFAAVLAVSSEPAVRSLQGGVRFSAAATAEAVSDDPALAEEMGRRDGVVPVLRLPFPDDSAPPSGFATEVCLPLRPEAIESVRQAISGLDPALLLALPGLEQVDLDGRLLVRESVGDVVRIGDGDRRQDWRCVSASGLIPAELLADRPVEERTRTSWSVKWAVPVDAQGEVRPLVGPQVLSAPTPSDEPIPVPARLIATFPLDPDRRHVAPGPLTGWLARQAGQVYADLLQALAGPGQVLSLVPSPALETSTLDGLLRTEILAAARDRAWLPALAGGLVVADRACVLEPELALLADLLADVLPGLLPAPWSAHRYRPAVSALGLRRVAAAEVVETLATVSRPPHWWREVYAALDDSGVDREALAGLPVPLVGGRVVTGARGVLLPGPGFPEGSAAALDLRLVDPEAAHPLLARLGALEATAQTVLAAPATQAQVADSFDTEGDPAVLADAVLALVRAAMLRPGDLPWLADLALLAADGDVYPAGELLLPSSPLADLMVADAPFGTVADDLVARFGAETLLACGVLGTFSLLDLSDVDSADGGHDLDEGERWLAEIADGQPVLIDRLCAVRDLELVRSAAWPEALRLLDAAPLREAIESPAILTRPDGSSHAVRSYTQWWLREHPVLGGQRPAVLRPADAPELAGLYDAAPDDADVELLGCPERLEDVLADRAGRADLLLRLGDPARSCPPVVLGTVYARLAAHLDDDPEPPPSVRVGPDLVCDAEQVVVLDRPWLVPLLTDWQVVPCSSDAREAVADLLDLPLASEVVGGPLVAEGGTATSWSAVPGAALAAQRLGRPLPGDAVTVHKGLSVGGQPVRWWVDDDGCHVDGSPYAFGRVLAWLLGGWPLRAAATEALSAAEDELLRREDATS